MNKGFTKINKEKIEKEKLKSNKKFPIPKWIMFCEEMLELGFEVKLYKAFSTFSKYVIIKKDEKETKIRFSNHKPNYQKQVESDSDLYVGVSHFGVITTEKVIEEIKLIYNLKDKKMENKKELLAEWTALKSIEEQAKARRDEISNELSGFYGIPEGKKSCTIKEDDFSIELKEAEKVEVDQVECAVLFASFESNQLPFRVKYELDAGKYRALKEISPAFYERCSQAVTITPGKVSVKMVKNGV